MKQMRYRGFSRRVITSDDWDSVGVKSKGIDVQSMEIIEVNDAAAAWLNENEAADWQEISEREAARMAKEAEDREAAAEAEAAAEE